MLIVQVKDQESIDQALKRFKRKFQRSQLIKEVRARREYTKPSVERRNERLKAIYRDRKMQEDDL